jgi:hypothetical protein
LEGAENSLILPPDLASNPAFPDTYATIIVYKADPFELRLLCPYSLADCPKSIRSAFASGRDKFFVESD